MSKTQAPDPAPHGYKLVPIDPTPDMVMEGGETLVQHTTEFLASLCEQAETVYRAMLDAAPAIPAPEGAHQIPGFSPMHLAPIDGTPVMLYMPTTADKFAVGRWHGSPDSLHGNWGDDEGNYYVHEPVCFMALSNLERLVQPSFKPQTKETTNDR